MITFIMEYENFTFPEALKFLADRAGVKLPEQDYSPEAKRQHDLRESILEVNKMAGTYYYYQLRSPAGKQGNGVPAEEGAFPGDYAQLRAGLCRQRERRALPPPETEGSVG